MGKFRTTAFRALNNRVLHCPSNPKGNLGRGRSLRAPGTPNREFKRPTPSTGPQGLASSLWRGFFVWGYNLGMTKRRSNLGTVVVIVLVLTITIAPFLYVASAGPAVFFAERDLLGENFIEAVYAPLDAAATRSRTVERALRSYVSLFKRSTRDYPVLHSY